jgi:cytochrome c oxidase subunit IV
MSTHTENTPEHGGHEAKVYFVTLIALLILTVITVGASYVDFGSGNIVIALFIATVKASLVALIFMHLNHEKPINAVIAVAGFLFLGIFLMFCFLDFDSRVNFQPVNAKPVVPLAAPASAPAAPAAEKK